MIWVFSKRQMGLRKEIVCLCFLLLLLMLLQFETSCHAGKAGRFGRLKGGSSSSAGSNYVSTTPVQANGGGGINGRNGDDHDEDGDDVFGVDKRKIHTGPNPLHNR